MNEKHHYEAAVTVREGRKVVILRRRIGTLRVEEVCLPLDDTARAVRLRVDADKLTYVFSVDPGDGCWVELGRGETRYLSKEVAGGFTGVYWGLYASGHGRRCRNAADFDRFSIEAVQA
jgi:alpha-N-arabinofuranosidase